MKHCIEKSNKTQIQPLCWGLHGGSLCFRSVNGTLFGEDGNECDDIVEPIPLKLVRYEINAEDCRPVWINSVTLGDSVIADSTLMLVVEYCGETNLLDLRSGSLHILSNHGMLNYGYVIPVQLTVHLMEV